MTEFLPDDMAAGLQLPKVMDEGLSLVIRPGALSYDYLTSYTIGPVQQADFSLGLANRIWRIRVYDKNVFLARAKDDNSGFEPETLLTVLPFQPTESDAAFDQSANVFLCMAHAGQIWFYWYDPLLAAYTVTSFGEARSPRCTLDQLTDRPDSDLHVFYIREDRLKYRVQRDRYLIEYDTGYVTSWATYVEDAAITTGGRVVVLLANMDEAGHYNYERTFSKLLPTLVQVEEYLIGLTPQSGNIVLVVQNVGPPGDAEAGFFDDVEEWKANLTPQSGILVEPIILHTTFDIEEWKANLVPQSGILIVVIIAHTTFDIEEWKSNLVPQSGAIAVVVIEHSTFDIEEWKANLTPQSGSLIVV